MLPTIVRWRVRSTHSSTTCPSSSTAMRDSCFVVALITISRDMRRGLYLRRRTSPPQWRPIYFSGSITGGREDVALYRRIVAALEPDGHRVLAGLGGGRSTSAPAATRCLRGRSSSATWAGSTKSDVVVAEVSKPSHGRRLRDRVRRAGATGCRSSPSTAPLTRQRCSAMIAGDPGVELIEYEDAEEMLDRAPGSASRDRE